MNECTRILRKILRLIISVIRIGFFVVAVVTGLICVACAFVFELTIDDND